MHFTRRGLFIRGECRGGLRRGQSLSWHCTAYDDEHAPEATFESDGSAEELEPGEYTAALTLNYAVDDGTGVSHLEPLVIENVKFTVSE